MTRDVSDKRNTLPTPRTDAALEEYRGPIGMVPADFTRKLESESISRELIKAMAMDIGKSLVAYIEVMYPEAIKATSRTFKLSMRNHVYNDIMSIIELHDEVAIRKRLAANETHRKTWVGMYRKMQRAK